MVDRLAWISLALLHLAPASALVRPGMIESLYGVSPSMAAFPLLQHRAGLFLAIMIACLWAAADPGVRRLASVVTALSMLSFLAVYWQAGAPAPLRTVALADLLFVPVLAVAAWRAFHPEGNSRLASP